MLAAFALGFGIGLFRVGRVAGMACLCLLGGVSIGVRIVLFRENLLVHNYAVNWVIIAVCGAISFAVILFRQRAAMVCLPIPSKVLAVPDAVAVDCGIGFCRYIPDRPCT